MISVTSELHAACSSFVPHSYSKCYKFCDKLFLSSEGSELHFTSMYVTYIPCPLDKYKLIS